MLVNPGGLIGPKDVVGRDGLIAKLWKRLDRQSVVLTGERRTGKTSILNKMRVEAPRGFVVLTQNPDLEGLHAPLEFVEQVYRDAERLLPSHRLRPPFRKVFESLAGFELAGVIKFPDRLAPEWKRLFDALLAALDAVEGERLVFLWDEMPVFVNNVRLRSGGNEAAGVLDVLRSVRQKHPRIRMVYTGSIGFHSVTDVLTEAGVNGPLLNDMWLQDVPPLAPDDGMLLAATLIDGEHVWTLDRVALAWAVAVAAGCIPFYIHHIVDALTDRAGPHDEVTVAAVVTAKLRDPNDPWLMSHYLTRTRHYPAYQRQVALGLLDLLAREEKVGFERLFALLQVRRPATDPEPVREVLTLLKRDFYLRQLDDGEYAFRSALLRQWWKHERA